VKAGTQITTPVRDWLIINATIDNTIAKEAIDGDSHTIERGQHIRDLGWVQTRQHPRKTDGRGGWPPVDEHLEITLEPSAWRFIAEQLRRWSAVGERVADDPRRGEEERKARRETQRGQTGKTDCRLDCSDFDRDRRIEARSRIGCPTSRDADSVPIRWRSDVVGSGVWEPICSRFQPHERLHVGFFPQRINAARGERNVDSNAADLAALLSRFLTGGHAHLVSDRAGWSKASENLRIKDQ